MRIRIWHKLLLAILLACSLVTLLNSAISYYSFQRAYQAYVQQLQQRQLQRVEAVLLRLYQETGSWQPLRHNPRLWHRLMIRAERGEPIRGQRLPPPVGGSLFINKVGLLDAGMQPIIGLANQSYDQRYPIEFAGQTIGYLVSHSRHPILDQIDQSFVRQQQGVFIASTLLSLLIALLAAYLLAKRLNRPLRQIDQAIHQLAAGDYQPRLAVKGNDELATLAQNLNQLAQKLEQHRHTRQQWIADISHELRTPLTVLRGEIEALEDGVRPFNAASLQSLGWEVKQLSRLVEDLYQLALSDQGSFVCCQQTIDPIELLQQTLNRFEDRLQQHPLRLEQELSRGRYRVFADAERLAQLYGNLLENSLRYTDAGGIIRVSCQTQQHQLQIDFEDSAPGVSAEHLPHLFERLYRVDAARSRASGGAGLGLSIAQSIAKAHGGQLSAQPSNLGGLKIRLCLPLQES